MKRVSLVLIAAMLLLVMSSCTAPITVKASPGIVGLWECTDLSEFTEAFLGATGDLMGMGFLGSIGDGIEISITIEFRSDNTYQMDMNAKFYIMGTDTQTSTGTYSWNNGLLIMDNEQVSCKLKGDTMTLSIPTPDGYTMVLDFERIQ